jgi:crescentin
LNQINIDLSARMADVEALVQTAEQRLIVTQSSLDRALEQVKVLEASGEENRQRMSATEAARVAAVDRAEQLAKSLAAQENAHQRSEKRGERLLAQLQEQQEEHQQLNDGLAAENAALRASIESARAESTIIVAALEAARKERTQRMLSERNGSTQNIDKSEVTSTIQ